MPPVALTCVEPPKQIEEGFAVAFTNGKAFTTIVLVAVLVQPLALVAVTVYVVVTLGVTVGEPVKFPGCQAYVVPPVALNCDEAPKQSTEGLADALTVGALFTVTVCVAVLVQPFALVAVTVYVVVTLGDTVGEPVKLPGCQAYVVPPVALNCDEPPTQIDDGFALVVINNALLTDTVCVAVAVHPLALVAVTVYVVVIVGDTIGEPVKLPGCHV